MDPMVNAIAEDQPWRLRYWVIFACQASSLIGSAMTQFVLLWWITDTTNSVSALATAGIFALLPQAIFSPLAGAFADRYSRRAIMISTDLISAACMLVLIALFHLQSIELWHVYTMMAVRSAMQAFQQPAAAASTAMLVPQSFITRAAGLNQILFGIMQVAAAPIGALAISVMPIGYALSIDVLTAVLAVGPLFFFVIPQIRTPKDQQVGVVADLKQGLRVVWKDRGLRWIYLLVSAVVLVVMPSLALVPLLVKEHFSGGALQVGIIESMSGLGMILGGSLVTLINPRKKIKWMIWGFSLSCFAIGATAAVPGYLFWAGCVFWFLSGFTFIAGNAPLLAAIQIKIPNEIQGRVISLLNTCTSFAAPLGLLLFSPLGEVIGVRQLYVVLGTVAGIIGLMGYLSKDVLEFEKTNHPV